ncbi:MAG: undecaprenyl-diphosphate phosphatase [Verrucomicrobia bacterium]|nr:undecaprenyl-diphosphate phosphatase [Verrucomicrobiota bacterium]
MPDWIAAITLGVIEGLTEFLPISSTGHLLIAEHWLPHQTELFNVVIQCGAVLAVLLVFAGRIKQLLAQWNEPAARAYLLKLILAFGLTGAGGLALKKAGMVLPKELAPIAWATLIGGVIMFAIEFLRQGKTGGQEVTWLMAVAIGGAQLLAAACPGTSRSGATIMIALALGLSRVAATEFTFLLSLPTMFAAGAWEIRHALKHSNGEVQNWTLVFLGTLVAALTAFAAVKWLLKFVQSHTFIGFAWYRVALGIILLVVIFRAGQI